ncbi:MAG: 30S ribosomal protein S12 methylthiotransferase RimO [candidate division Zixibacteria bacterium]|nr:30S ribosomal protein S12 methylthiotransferase RimO [candidate division Zixibacteria bacterium]
MKIKVNLTNLGCPKNEVDGESMVGLLCEEGYEMTAEKEAADILILNTCGFIDSAKEESINEIFNLIYLKNKDRRKKIIISGCLAQRYPEELWENIPEIDGLLGVGDIFKISKLCSSVLVGKRLSMVSFPENNNGKANVKRKVQNRPYAYIKIADGCDNHCSYCAIPGIRGKFRSKRIEDILKEARQLVDCGIKEINLVAQDTTLYGTDIYGERKLPQLLLLLSEIPKLEWIRLLYTHPAHFSDELIEQVASNPKACKYVDLPLQHISDEILAQMNRKVKRRDVEQLVSKLREKIPDLTLRTTFIVGFPGERKKHFEELVEFVERTRFDKLGAFPYSREEETPAYSFKGQLSSKLKHQRLDQLMLTQQKIVFEENKSKIGKTLTVLIDAKSKESNGYFLGRSQAEAPEVDGVILVKGNSLKIDEFVKVKIIDYCDYDLVAEVVKN